MEKDVKKPIVLTKEQERQALSAPRGVDLSELTKQISGDPNIDGRSAFGRAIRDLRKTHKLPYKIKESKSETNVVLSPSDKLHIEKRVKQNERPFRIAVELFESASHKVKPLSAEHRVVEAYVKDNMSDYVDEGQKLTTEKYRPPSTFKQTLAKINDVTKLELKEDKLDSKIKKRIEKCLIFCQAHRFVMFSNSLVFQQERDLFEAEFVRAVWEKPDLTGDELNLCYNLCEEYLKQFKINKIISRFEEIMENVRDDKDGKMSMSIVETIKNHREDHKKSVELQKKLVESLNGSRNQRMQDKKEGNRSISQLVEYVQEEENRQILRKSEELKKQIMSETIKDYQDASELIVNIYGVDEEDLLEF